MPKTVLLVEDNPDLRHIYALLLRHGGYRVVVAHNGAEALSMLQQEAVDLIVMDLVMPTMNGWEAARALKGQPRTAGIPILAATVHVLELSGMPDAADLFVGYLAKPFPPTDLLQEVVARIGPPLDPSETPLPEAGA